jgi:hypothetical protein
MMTNTSKSAAFAAFTEQLAQDRAGRIAREVAAVQPAAAEQQDGRLGDLFAEAFTGTRQEPDPGPGPRRWESPQQRPWDAALALAADDDAPRPPGPAGEPAPAAVPPVPPVVDDSPQARRMSADEVFQEMEQRLTATVEVTELPPDVQLRRAFRDLPGGQREAIAKLIESEDFGLPGYFDSRNFGPDYVATLVASALARRFADAARLQPDLSPAALLEQITAAANPGN